MAYCRWEGDCRVHMYKVVEDDKLKGYQFNLKGTVKKGPNAFFITDPVHALKKLKLLYKEGLGVPLEAIHRLEAEIQYKKHGSEVRY